MYSPLYPETPLRHIELEPGLAAFSCPKSGGHWIALQSYFIWMERHRSKVRSLPADYTPQASTDALQRALICPESGCILIRYRVGHGLSFQIDRSPRTGGVWLDAGEWDALKKLGLHDELHLIFTAPYQRDVRTELSNQRLREQFQRRIGEADFERAAQFKRWIQQHPSHRDILAYLLDERESEGLSPGF